MIVALLFGVGCVAFGLWLHPKWERARRARLESDDKLLFSPRRARERWLWAIRLVPLF
jgi:hypothetical protein